MEEQTKYSFSFLYKICVNQICFSLSLPHGEPRYKQCTVMMIKPDAVQECKVEEIVEAVKSLEILAQEEHQFTREHAEEFYQQHKDEVCKLSNNLGMVLIIIIIFD